MHLVGAGLLIFSRGGLYMLTLDLVPLQLIFTTLIILKFQKGWNLSLLIYIGFSFVIGFLVELVGVNTGWPFGDYSYGPVLGTQILGTPLLIGLNWFLVSYISGCIVQKLPVSFWLKVVAGTFLMVALDFFMEPIAMKHNFWNWKNGFIPNQNYLAWAVVSFFILSIYQLGTWNKENSIAPWVYVVMLMFFVIQNIF